MSDLFIFAGLKNVHVYSMRVLHILIKSNNVKYFGLLK